MFADAASPSAWSELSAGLLGWAAVAAAAGLAAGLFRLLYPPARGPLFPRQRQRAVPWGLREIVLLLFLTLLCLDSVRVAFGLAAEPDEPKKPAAAAKPPPPRTPEQRLREAEALVVFAALEVGLAALILVRLGGAQPYQFGLEGRQWARDAVTGCAAAAAVLPATALIAAGVRLGLEALGLPPEESPDRLETYLVTQPWSAVHTLWCLIIVVAAPLAEEVLFRGALLRWLTDYPLGADSVLLTGLLFAIGLGTSEETKQPYWWAAFLGTVGPGYLLFEWLTRRWLPRPGAARAIFATSLVFAVLAGVPWPGQIEAFFRGLGLGYVAYRTQGLVAPVVMHGLFGAADLAAVWLLPAVG